MYIFVQMEIKNPIKITLKGAAVHSVCAFFFAQDYAKGRTNSPIGM